MKRTTLNTIVNAFIEAIVFAETPEGYEGSITFSEVSKKKIGTFVERFIKDNKTASNEFIKEYSLEQFGHSLFLTARGHGAGFGDFWDDYANELREQARKESKVEFANLYIENGVMYFEL